MEYRVREYRSFKCLISVPVGATREGGWPLLVFLHRSGEAAPNELNAALTTHGPLCARSGCAATRRFVVVAPQLPEPGSDVWELQAGAVKAIGLDVANDYGGNFARIYLTGFSFGGNGVLKIGVRERDAWAALWPVDPTMRPAEGTDRPLWLSAGPLSRANKAAFRNVWGLQDCVPEAPPHSTRVYEDAGLNHVDTASAAYRNDDIYCWLLTHCSRNRPHGQDVLRGA